MAPKKKVEKVDEFTPEPEIYRRETRQEPRATRPEPKPEPKIHPKIGPPKEIDSNMRRQIRRGHV